MSRRARAPRVREAVSRGVLVRLAMGYLLAIRGEDVPLGTELADVLARYGSGRGVRRVVIEGVARVGHLGGAVGPLRGAEQRGAHPGARLRCAGDGERRP